MKITPIQLAKRVERWGKTLASLGVAHFEFDVAIVDEVPPDGGGNAAVWVADDYDVLHFYFKHEYLEASTEGQLDQTIVHEWMHVAMRDHDQFIQGVESWMPPTTFEQWIEDLKHEREGLVDRLANVIVQLHGGNPARFSP
jgi:hypothetical protein